MEHNRKVSVCKGSIHSHSPYNACPLRYNTLHFSNWSVEVTAAVNTYQATVIEEAQMGYDGQDIPGDKMFTGLK